MKRLFLFLLLASCRQAPTPAVIEAGAWPPPVDALAAPVNVRGLPAAVSPVDVPAAVSVSAGSSTLAVFNATAKAATVFVAFGSDSVVLPASWAFCTPTAALNCSFPLPAGATQTLDLGGGGYLNASFSFDLPVGCGSSKSELNLNNPKWYDTADLSLVDGYNHDLSATLGTQQLGPILSADGNAKVLGVFPLGCDICVARQAPPCGLPPSPVPGTAGCKSGSDQYHPDVPCQVQGLVMGGGSPVLLTLLP